MASVIVYADEASTGRQLASAAKSLGDPVLVTLGEDNADALSRYYKRVYLLEDSIFDPLKTYKPIMDVIDKESTSIVLSPCSNKGRMIAGLIAGGKNFNVATDVMKLEHGDEKILVTKLTFGGNAYAKLSMTKPLVACIASGSYKESEPFPEPGEIIRISPGDSSLSVKFTPRRLEGADPTKAEVVVGAGRGLKKKEDLEMIKELASLLGGAWSVTRPLAADYGWADSWIGISGLIISPKLYIAIGISGQPHHTMGVRGSKVIVAINNDESAPIFEEADYGVVGDLYNIVPVLIEKLKQRKK
ncbi:MAG: electron transfer flavoprotein subunit alpha/FixB family protein [Desulfurococcales archaeon]|nr:electron transfer flavoprotein subunit alpha/FixB family protein [Desulfurococcales archaeon]